MNNAKNGVKIEGISKFDGGEYSRLKIDGVTNCDGDIKAESIDIDGIFNCSGTITADSIDIDGVFNCKGAITADSIDCDGTANFKGSIFVKELDVDGVFKISAGNKLEAEKIFCDGIINICGQVSADLISANGVISADEIVGDKICIKTHIGRFWRLFVRKSKIKLIEATTVELEGVIAAEVNGKDIIIGRNCRIENVDCSGTLRLHPRAKVKNITGNYKNL